MNAPRTEPGSIYFIPTALAELRAIIADHAGNEVFFVGRPGEVTGKIQTVEALCRGNGHAVPAILDAARSGEVVIHNHPSGVLLPSDADLSLASHYGNCGVGFLIVDNQADQVMAVVKPFARTPRKKLLPDALEARLGSRGELAQTLPGYEHRAGQLDMASTVLNAFNDDGIAVVEAGTGTGKSLAYLLPAALSALANKEVVVVATHTINLQEQLFSKDAPQVLKLQGFGDLKVALMKGRSNYLCNRKYLYYKESPADLFDPEVGRVFEDLGQWYRNTPTGTRSELSFQLPDDLWERLAADEDDCTRVKCPQYDECFYFKARREAAGAHILIANQHLLLADLAVRHSVGDYKRAFVLPPYRRIILDEAHHLEEVATSFISGKVTVRGLVRLLGRLHSSRTVRRQSQDQQERRGLLVMLLARLAKAEVPRDLQRRIVQHVNDRLDPRVESLRRMVRMYLGEIAFQLKIYMQDHGKIEGQFRIRPEFTKGELWLEVIESRLKELDANIAVLGAELEHLLAAWEELPERFKSDELQIGLELTSIRSKLTTFTRRLREFLTGGDNLVRWLELEKAATPEPMVAVCCSPIEVSSLLQEMVFEPLKTVILTSATLSVSGSFDYLKERVGLSKVPSSRIHTLSVPSPFDYARQVYLGIPADFPEPRERGYQERLIDMVEAALERSRGGAFVLFTSYQLLNAVHDAIRSRGRIPYPLLKHGEESRHRLLARFKSENNAVLFGTDSFWEGVDVQGEALRLVIISRLPFQVPSEPIQEARAERVVERGGDPFRDISLPQAVIKFKQGFGRLIRHKEDRGVVLVLDQRIVGKAYGRHFLEAIHGVQPVAAPSERILADVEAFYAGTYVPRLAPPSQEPFPLAADGGTAGRFSRFRPPRGR